LALAGYGRYEPARQAADWLADAQAGNGAVSVRPGHSTPRWPTSLAVLAWLADAAIPGGPPRQANIDRAVSWILSMGGEILETAPYLGHDTTLVAWPWVQGTHSWIEPSALHLLALKAAGLADHARAREAVRLLIDRQLPSGGCNCGNTFVMGAQLRPHTQPTGLALLALAGEQDSSGKVERSLQQLARNISARSTISSLAWALHGLAAHDRAPAQANAWLETAHQRSRKWGQSPYKDALAALASLCARSPLVALTQPSTAMGKTGKTKQSDFQQTEGRPTSNETRAATRSSSTSIIRSEAP
jgi:hypothetical protein